MGRLVVRPPGDKGKFPHQWLWNQEQRRLENAPLGAAVQVFHAVDEDTGEVKYEGIALESRRIELNVVVRKDDRCMAFVSHWRLSVIPPIVSVAEFEKNPMRILRILEHGSGIKEYEACHGLAEIPQDEVREEIGLEPIEWESIGFVKECPPLGGVAHELFAVLVADKVSSKALEPNEQIQGVVFIRPEEVKNIVTMCGLTQAALWRFRAWGLEKAKESIWNEVASRM